MKLTFQLSKSQSDAHAYSYDISFCTHFRIQSGWTSISQYTVVSILTELLSS